MNLRYITIPADTEEVESQDTIDQLFGYLNDGWDILSAVGLAGGVHYIIKQNPQTVKLPDLGNIRKAPPK